MARLAPTCLRQNKAYRILLFAVCALTVIIGFWAYTTSQWGTLVSASPVRLSLVFHKLLLSKGRPRQPVQLKCANVLGKMVTGRWMRRQHTKSELDEVQRFLHIAREQHYLPYNLQRRDNRCGNVSFGGLHQSHAPSLLWFRALCDADGYRACCYNNRCEAKSEEECRCPECYDLRQSTHAELAIWTPSDPSCQMAVFEHVEDVCQVLQGMTIYFIGDSLVRHHYLALLQLLRAQTNYGPMMEYTPLGMKMACNEQNMYLGMCANVLDRETWECEHTVKLKFMEYPYVSQGNLTLEAVEEIHKSSNNSLLVFGIGIHDNFDINKVKDQVLMPVLEAVLTRKERLTNIYDTPTRKPGKRERRKYSHGDLD